MNEDNLTVYLLNNLQSGDYANFVGEFTKIIDKFLYKHNCKHRSYLIRPFKYPEDNEYFKNQIISAIRIPGETIGGIWVNEENKIYNITISNDIFQTKNVTEEDVEDLISKLKERFLSKELIFFNKVVKEENLY